MREFLGISQISDATRAKRVKYISDEVVNTSNWSNFSHAFASRGIGFLVIRWGHDDEASEARRREAPRGWGLGRGIVVPPQYIGVWGVAAENFRKSTLKLHIFLWFYQRDTIAKLTAGITIALLYVHLSVRLSVTPAVRRGHIHMQSHNTIITLRIGLYVKQQSSVCNSGAIIFFQFMSHDGGHLPMPPSGSPLLLADFKNYLIAALK